MKCDDVTNTGVRNLTAHKYHEARVITLKLCVLTAQTDIENFPKPLGILWKVSIHFNNQGQGKCPSPTELG